ncbi:MAG: hypothetical protein DRJ03_03450 [Chloroflexi bacterium]|nr:MAG: hypothetical protein DRJ03_03450 [Chloroflexota bacterium]
MRFNYQIIRERREEMGLTIESFSGIADLSISRICALEKGDVIKPWASTINKLCRALGVERSQLWVEETDEG